MSHDDDAQLNALFASAASAGIISSATQTLLSGHLGSVVIAGAAGKPLEDLEAADVTLITVLVDASSSIAHRGLEQAVRDGQTALLDAFAGSKEEDSILVALWTFADSTKVVHAYVPVADATRLDKKNYRGQGSTVLYDVWCDALASNVAYAEQLRSGGTPVRSVVVVVTDGEDCGSRRTAHECARISRDLLASEQFILALVGVGSEPDFVQVGTAMGIPPGCIAVQRDATPHALREVFQMVSRSAIRASRGQVRPGVHAGFFGP